MRHNFDQSDSLQSTLPCTAAMNDQITVEMDENDIPGTALSAPLEGHTVPELFCVVGLTFYMYLTEKNATDGNWCHTTGLIGKR